MRNKLNIRVVAAVVLLAMCLCGCNDQVGQTQPPIQQPTVPPDGTPGNETCQGSYTGTDAELAAAAGTVVATLGDAQLTNGQLQMYYSMAVHNYTGEDAPDLSKPLDTQLCGVDETAVTWQQYFLRQALENWRGRQALVLRMEQESFSPGERQQEHLRSLPELTQGDAVLLAYARMLNLSNLYFTARYESVQPTEEELEAYLADNPVEAGVCVDIRHILLDTGAEDAQAMMEDWQKSGGREDGFAMLAQEHSLDAGSSANGGLYRSLRKGWLMDKLDAWCFDPARQVGEWTIIETELGLHILYFRGSSDVALREAEEQLRYEHGLTLMQDVLAEFPFSVDYGAIVLGQVKDCTLTDPDLLCPASVQERYPEVPLMIQQDYPYTYYGPGRTVASHGCGLTCFAMIATYLLDEEQSPEVLGPRFASYSAPEGTARSLFDQGPAAMGFAVEKRTNSDEEAMAALENGQVVVSLQKKGLFTNGGHYLILAKLQDDGKITVLDPNTYNYIRNSIREDGFANGFEPKYITAGASIYWIYAKKQLNDPVCARCGDASKAILFRETYYCADCREQQTRDELYRTYCG